MAGRQWEAADMAKRALRVVKNLGRIPAVAVCTVCGKTFEAPLGALVGVKDAEANLQQQCYRDEDFQCSRRAGTNNDDIGLGVVTNSLGSASTVVNADSNTIAFSRTTAQVLSIVYAGGTGKGGFFPAGLNGTIK
jgi:hypothetical protein